MEICGEENHITKIHKETKILIINEFYKDDSVGGFAVI